MVLGSHVLATLQLYDFSTLKKSYEHHGDVTNHVYSSTEEDPSELPKEVPPLEDSWAGAPSRSATSLKNLSDKRLSCALDTSLVITSAFIDSVAHHTNSISPIEI